MEPHQRHCLLSPLSPCPGLSNSSHSFERPQTKLSVDRLVSKPCLPVEHCPVRHAVEQRPEGGVATAVVVILKNRSRLDGNRDDSVRLESVCWPGEASRSALRNLFHRRAEVMQACPTNLPILSVIVFWLDSILSGYPSALAFYYDWSDSSDKSASTEKIAKVKYIFHSRIFEEEKSFAMICLNLYPTSSASPGSHPPSSPGQRAACWRPLP